MSLTGDGLMEGSEAPATNAPGQSRSKQVGPIVGYELKDARNVNAAALSLSLLKHYLCTSTVPMLQYTR